MNTDIETTISAFSPAAKRKANALHRLILATAKRIPEVGELTETLKWGEPAYLTEQTKSGSTIRIAWKQKNPEQIALMFNCQTTLVDGFRTRFPELSYEGSRALVLQVNEALPTEALKECIAAALTYHRAKKR